MKKLVAEKLQRVLNHYLALDPESSARLQKLNGKVVTLELLGLNWIFQIIFIEGQIHLKQDDFSQPDTTIKGTPLSLLRMTLTKGDRKHFFAKDVSIEGNLDLGQYVIDLFDNLEIDWEEYFSRWVGDIPAHQVGRFIHSVKDFMQRARKVLLQNMNEYLHEEIELFPAVEALADFFNDIDELRMDVDRIQARIDRIKMQISEIPAET